MSALLFAILAAQDARQQVSRFEKAVTAAEKAYSQSEVKQHRCQASQHPSVRQQAAAEATTQLDNLDECRQNLEDARRACRAAEACEQGLRAGATVEEALLAA